jgi:hypothetical protein
MSTKWPLLILPVVSFSTLGCHQKSQTEASNAVLTIEQVATNPQQYSHQLLTVQGCFVHSFERLTLQPCGDPKHDQLIWVDSADAEFAFRNRTNFPRQYVPKELQSEPRSPDYFVFTYDEKKSNAAWSKLASFGSEPTRVIFYGQFDTVAPNRANTDPYDFGHGFGHLGQYEHRRFLLTFWKFKTRTDSCWYIAIPFTIGCSWIR